ncbi:protein enabled homolog [Triticum dicoccoides]|uniref:protein enabled homolog n=1 Tax=Triticum dicoccoides TaxID=85692 RepID=UPI00188EC4B7|nr:protein enabled homolog [Triticum dicoccoides]
MPPPLLPLSLSPPPPPPPLLPPPQPAQLEEVTDWEAGKRNQAVLLPWLGLDLPHLPPPSQAKRSGGSASSSEQGRTGIRISLREAATTEVGPRCRHSAQATDSSRAAAEGGPAACFRTTPCRVGQNLQRCCRLGEPPVTAETSSPPSAMPLSPAHGAPPLQAQVVTTPIMDMDSSSCAG